MQNILKSPHIELERIKVCFFSRFYIVTMFTLSRKKVNSKVSWIKNARLVASIRFVSVKLELKLPISLFQMFVLLIVTKESATATITILKTASAPMVVLNTMIVYLCAQDTVWLGVKHLADIEGIGLSLARAKTSALVIQIETAVILWEQCAYKTSYRYDLNYCP